MRFLAKGYVETGLFAALLVAGLITLISRAEISAEDRCIAALRSIEYAPELLQVEYAINHTPTLIDIGYQHFAGGTLRASLARCSFRGLEGIVVDKKRRLSIRLKT